MTNPTARAVASIAAAGGCGAIAWAEPMAAFLAVIGVIASMYSIWSRQ